jgi:D-glycero-alpha-D-manno-heptose-7-phosphate kinase
VLDAGGWTDTWFAHHGTVCHLAVEPGTEAIAQLSPAGTTGPAEVDLDVRDFGDHYRFRTDHLPGRHPLLEAALRRWAPAGRLDIAVGSAVPAGSSLGTSASVLVALITALQQLSGPPTVHDATALARAAHEVETVELSRQSGVQDQVAAAFGGANLVDIDPYPSFRVHALHLPVAMRDDLSHRLLTVYLGTSHDSSAVHSTVIQRLAGNADDADRLLAPMRASAASAAAALAAGDLAAYGQAMIANTEAQAALHPTLVNPSAHHVIGTAARYGALGWKVNGAGGAGGTVSIVTAEDPGPLRRSLEAVPDLVLLPLGPAGAGARVVDRGCGSLPGSQQ